MELLGSSLEYKQRSLLSDLFAILDTKTFCPFASKSLKVDFEFGISNKIRRFSTSPIDLVLKVGSFLYDACNLTL